MNDDLNTAVGIAQLFTLLKYINMLYLNQLQASALGEDVFNLLNQSFATFMQDVLGLQEEGTDKQPVLEGLLTLVSGIQGAKAIRQSRSDSFVLQGTGTGYQRHETSD